MPSIPSLTHIDESGRAGMVDISTKPPTVREALASGYISMHAETCKLIKDNGLKKGEVLSTARLAGIMAAKQTASLIPLCHPLQLSTVRVDVSVNEALPGVSVEAFVRTTASTGVEMEALTAVTVSLLTVYDMAKAVDRGMTISEVKLLEKRGGTSGDWIAEKRE